VKVRSNGTFEFPQIAVRITSEEGTAAFTTCNTDQYRGFVPIGPGAHDFEVEIPADLLVPGRYTLNVISHLPQVRVLDLIDDSVAFTVEEAGSIQTACREIRLGVVSPILKWRCTTKAQSPIGLAHGTA
jgi:hypothetical protein